MSLFWGVGSSLADDTDIYAVSARLQWGRRGYGGAVVQVQPLCSGWGWANPQILTKQGKALLLKLLLIVGSFRPDTLLGVQGVSLPSRQRMLSSAAAAADTACVVQVMIWDDHQGRCIGELSFRSQVHQRTQAADHNQLYLNVWGKLGLAIPVSAVILDLGRRAH